MTILVKFEKKLFVLCFLAYTSIYVARLNLTAASPYLQNGSILTESQLGRISSAFLIVYAFGRLLNGAMCDRLQPRRIIFVGSIVIGLSNLALATLPSFPLFCLLWGINGYAQSMLWGPVLRTVCAKTSPKKKTVAVSILGSSVCVGNVVGLVASFSAIDSFGVRYAFLLPGILSVFIALATCFFFRIDIEKGDDATHNFPQIAMLKQPSIRQMLVPAMLHGVLKDNLNVWVALFFASVYQIDTSAIPLFIFAVPITGMVGRLACPFLYRAASNKSIVVNICSFSICALAALLLSFGKVSALIAAVLLCFLSASVQVINNSVLGIFPSSFEKNGNVSQVAGWMDFFTYLGAGISSNIYGRIIEHFGFNTMFASWCGLSIIAIAWLFYTDCRKPYAK